MNRRLALLLTALITLSTGQAYAITIPDYNATLSATGTYDASTTTYAINATLQFTNKGFDGIIGQAVTMRSYDNSVFSFTLDQGPPALAAAWTIVSETEFAPGITEIKHSWVFNLDPYTANTFTATAHVDPLTILEVGAGRTFKTDPLDYTLSPFTVSPLSLLGSIPEPTSIALIGMGLFGFAASRIKKNQS